MPRADEYSGQVSNPVKKYLSWDSDNKCFKYYDKGIKQNLTVKLPLKFISLKQMSTIKGFYEPDNCGIYSNEIPLYQLKKKEFVVKTMKGKTIASGIYEKIKGDLAVAGAKFATNIYAYIGGEIVSLTLVGSSFSAWYDFINLNSEAIKTQYIEINGSTDEKKGKTVYSKPVFSIGALISDNDLSASDDAYDSVVAYIKGRDGSVEEDNNQHAPSGDFTPVNINNSPVAEPFAETVEDNVLPF